MKGSWLQIEAADKPESIIWENLRYGIISRYLRFLILYCFSFGMTIGAFKYLIEF
jgi:hypothetical protein